MRCSTASITARDSALRARVLITLAAALVRQDQPARAAELYEEAIELRRDAGDHEALGVALLGRGVVLAQADASTRRSVNCRARGSNSSGR